MLKKLLLALLFLLPIVSQGAANPYDGNWKFSTDCVARKGVWGRSVIEFNNSKIENGHGHFLGNSQRGPATLDVTFSDHHVAVVRVTKVNTEVVGTWQWVLKAEGVMVDNDKFQISGVSWPLGMDSGIASDCVITGAK